MESEMKDVLNELREIRVDIKFIKDHMQESFLSEEEHMELDENLDELKQGRAFSLEEIKRDR